MNFIVKLLIFPIIAYIYLFVIAKCLGKKQISQLTFIDYVVGITIGSIAAEMVTDLEQPFYHYLIAMGVFFLVDLFINFIGRKSKFLKELTSGAPLIIISDGKFSYEKLKKSKLTINEFCGMTREKGYFHLEDIAFAVFETSGKLSILPKCSKAPVVVQDINMVGQKAQLDQYYVVDGKVSKDSLEITNKDEKWLFNELKIENKQQLSNILLAYYDEVEQNFIVHYKQYDQ